MAEVLVEFLSVATVRRQVRVDVPAVGTQADQLMAARAKAATVMAKDEDRNNVQGSWEVLRVIDPPFIDSAPRFVAPGVNPIDPSFKKPSGLFG